MEETDYPNAEMDMNVAGAQDTEISGGTTEAAWRLRSIREDFLLEVMPEEVL